MSNYNYYKTTRSVCPVCREIIPAKIVFIDNSVFMLKTCRKHGEFKALLSRNQNSYMEALRINKHAVYPLNYNEEQFNGCGYSCGLCNEHQQHTCLPIIEITDFCNLSCPVCLASNKNSFHMKPDEFRSIINNLLSVEGCLDLINLSGGEPTLNPYLPELIEIASRPEITSVSISTNGKIFLKNPDLLLKLIDKNIFISLQFDGFSGAVYKETRGEDLLEEKLRILDLLEKHSARTSLVMTLINGINLTEISNVISYFLNKDFIKSLMFQPIVFVNERYPYDISKAVTLDDVISGISAASSGLIQNSDIINLPCSHPSCFALTYLLKLEGGGYIPLNRLINVEDYLDTIKNKVIPGLEMESYEYMKDNIYRLWSSSGINPGAEKITGTIKNLICEVSRLGRKPEVQKVFKVIENNVKSIFIHHFMDPYNFDLARAMKCCNHYALDNNRLIPCCTFNNLQRVR